MKKINPTFIVVAFGSVLFWNLAGLGVIWLQYSYWGYQPVTQALTFAVFGYVLAHRVTSKLLRTLNIKKHIHE